MSDQYNIKAEEVEYMPFLLDMSRQDVIRIIVSGVMAGFVTIASFLAMKSWIFGPILCGEGVTGCSDVTLYSTSIALLIGGILGLIALTYSKTYRPMFIVLGSALSLWGLNFVLADVAWYFAFLFSMVIFALGYLVFGWISRIRSFILASTLAIVLIVVSRLIL